MVGMMEYQSTNFATIGELFYGSFPSRETLIKLKEEKVDLVWNLMAELPGVLKMEKEYFQVIHTPIYDYWIPEHASFLQDLDSVCSHLDSGKNVFVHCLGGHGRTGMALACMAIRLMGMTPNEALMLSKKLCNGPEVEEQKDFVRTIKDFQK